MKTAIGALLLLVLLPLRAQETILATGGDMAFPVPIQGQAIAFALADPHCGVTIEVRLGNGGGRAPVEAYLMERVGPDVDEADEIARTSLELGYPHDGWITLFSGLDLEQGGYWLVVGKPKARAHSSLNWFASKPGDVTTTCGVRWVTSRSFIFHSDAAEYLPASNFAPQKYEPHKFLLRVTADHDACP